MKNRKAAILILPSVAQLLFLIHFLPSITKESRSLESVGATNARHGARHGIPDCKGNKLTSG